MLIQLFTLIYRDTTNSCSNQRQCQGNDSHFGKWRSIAGLQDTRGTDSSSQSSNSWKSNICQGNLNFPPVELFCGTVTTVFIDWHHSSFFFFFQTLLDFGASPNYKDLKVSKSMAQIGRANV